LSDLCNDCAWPDECFGHGKCHRRELAVLDIEAIATKPKPVTARTLIDQQSWPTKFTAVFNTSERPRIEDVEQSRVFIPLEPGESVEIKPIPIPRPGFYGSPSLFAWALKQNRRAQIRKSVDEAHKIAVTAAAALVHARTWAEKSDASELMHQQVKTALAQLEALPEIIASRFGLEIVGDCSACTETMFKDEAAAAAKDGRSVCERCVLGWSGAAETAPTHELENPHEN